MDSTPFSKRVEIMGDFYSDVQDNVEVMFSDFVLASNETLWICLASNAGYVVIQDRFAHAVNETWDAFCEYHGMDKYGNYDSYAMFLELSNA